MIDFDGELVIKMKVLVVDDDEHVREYLEMFLVNEGYAVTVASSSAIALDLVSRVISPDVVVADFNLGGALDGVDVAQKLMCRCPDAGLVLISGRPDLAEAKLSAHAYGRMSDVFFLAKPFVGSDLLAAIDRVVPAAGRAAREETIR